MAKTKDGQRVQAWRYRHRKLQRLYNYRSNARAYIRKWADISDLDDIIQRAEKRKQQLMIKEQA